MGKKHKMTPEEARDLFAELDASGVLDPDDAPGCEQFSRGIFGSRRTKKRAAKKEAQRAAIDPLSDDDPSGSQVSKTISRTAVLVIMGVFVFVLGMQIVYGVSRRLNTAALGDRANAETVSHALDSGVEWGNGFTPFPREFTVN